MAWLTELALQHPAETALAAVGLNIMAVVGVVSFVRWFRRDDGKD